MGNMRANARKLKKYGDQLLLPHTVHKEAERLEVCREWEVCLAVECLVEEWEECLEWETSLHRAAETHLARRLMKWINFRNIVFLRFVVKIMEDSVFLSLICF